jgi:cell fate (sporulation/competence/biofilm development) regulator YlbF (YheA/YmcA/DUF963 family)
MGKREEEYEAKAREGNEIDEEKGTLIKGFKREAETHQSIDRLVLREDLG